MITRVMSFQFTCNGVKIELEIIPDEFSDLGVFVVPD
jgi:hypothetical protein